MLFDSQLIGKFVLNAIMYILMEMNLDNGFSEYGLGGSVI